jgi:signal transduction histidine kinase/ActR/RegA family two-component response regulator
MAPSTALLIFLLGGATVLLVHAASHRIGRMAGATAVSLVFLFCVLNVLEMLTGVRLDLERLLVRHPEQFGAVLVGRISPATAAGFLLLSFSALLLFAPVPRSVSGGIAAIVAFGSLVILTGYLYGIPLLYDGKIIPMALTTALAFLALSVGVIAAIGPDHFPLRPLVGSSARALLLRSFLPVSIAIILTNEIVARSFQDRLNPVLVSALESLASVVVVSVVVSQITRIIGGTIDRAESERRRAEEETRVLNVQLERRVTERTAQLAEANQGLEQARGDADRANRAKSEFLSRMSHELRTPLNGILGFAQLLEMDHLAAEQRESVEYILKGGRHLLELINEVLDIARIEAGRLRVSLEPVPVGEVIGETLDFVRPLAANANIQVTAGAKGTTERYVVADRQRLRQVLLNLLSNAVKYNRPGGTAALSCVETRGGRLQIRVSDTGLGISPENIQRLFTPFERLGADQTGIEGSGLGLALSKRLTEAMGGTLNVESAVGRGSTFWAEFALTESPIERLEREIAEAPGSADRGASRKPSLVLYIEDNLPNLKLIERLLAHRPEVKLMPAMQGRLGVDLAREHRPDLILLDLHLPDIMGDEVLRQLREIPATRETPVVMISADATAGQIKRLLDAGARAYLTKPLDVKKFLVLLDEILGELNPDRVG